MYIKKWKNIKVQPNIQTQRRGAHVALFETNQFHAFVLFSIF